MPRFGLVGPTYEAQSPNLDAQLTVNWYVEQDESGAGNAPIALLSTPGIQSFVELIPPEPPPPPPPPPPGTPADIYNTINIPRSGHFTGNILTITPFVSGPEIKVGDTLFIAFYIRLVGSTTPVSGVNFNYLGSSLGTFNPIGPFLDYGSGPDRLGLNIYYCTSLIDVPAGGLIGGTITEGVGDYIINWTCIRNLTTLDQVSSDTFISAASFPATPITIAESEFVFSYIWTTLGGLSVTIPPPFTIYTNQLGGEAAGVRTGFDFISPPGVYTPTWASNSGLENAGMITASFKLSP